MKKSKRLILVLLICIFTVVSLFLIACDKDPDTPDDPNKPSVDNPNDPDNPDNPDNPNNPDNPDKPTPPPLTPDDPHEHSFTSWGHDDTNHWKVCSLCGEKDDSTVEAHKFSGSWTVSKQANCTEKGVRERSCECGAKETNEINIEPNSHDYDESNLIVDIPASCVKEGSGHYICKHDPTHISAPVTIPVDSNAHFYNDNNWKTSKSATCTAPGEQQNTCANGCGTTITKEIPKLDHKFIDNWTTDERFGGRPATCHTLGTEVRFCTLCYVEKETRQTEDYDPTNHEYRLEYTNVDQFSHKQVATCGCTDAKDRVTRHSYVARGNNVECDLCNFKGTSHSNNSTIEYDSAGGVTYLAPGNSGDTTIIIPAVQGGKVVTTLGPGVMVKPGEDGKDFGIFGKKGASNNGTQSLVKFFVIPYTVTLAKEDAFGVMPNPLWQEGGIYFEGTPNNIDDIDMGHYIEVIKNNGKETPVDQWSSGWTIESYWAGGWANQLIFYSERNPYKLTLEEQKSMGIVNGSVKEAVDLINNTDNNLYQYHKNFRPSSQKTSYKFRFWHWDKDGKPVLWSESDADDSDKDKGNHATIGADAYYSSETYSSTSVSTLRGIHYAPSSDLIVLPRYVNNKRLGIIKDRAFNPTDCSDLHSGEDWFDKDLQSSIISFSKYVLPDTLMAIKEFAFKNSTSGTITIYFEGSLEIWKTINISEGNDDLNNAITGGRFYLYSYEDPKTLTDNPLPTEWQRSESQTISLKYWHWSNSQPTPWN